MGLNKKGGIGRFFTQFAGFIIIFFMLAIFLATTTFLSGKKAVAGGWDEIDLKKYGSGNLDSQEILFEMLDVEVNGEGVKEMILRWDAVDDSEKGLVKEEIEIGLDDFFVNLDGCYVFEVDNSGGERRVMRFGSEGVDEDDFLKRVIEFNLYGEWDVIGLKFHFEECGEDE